MDKDLIEKLKKAGANPDAALRRFSGNKALY